MNIFFTNWKIDENGKNQVNALKKYCIDHEKSKISDQKIVSKKWLRRIVRGHPRRERMGRSRFKSPDMIGWVFFSQMEKSTKMVKIRWMLWKIKIFYPQGGVFAQWTKGRFIFFSQNLKNQIFLESGLEGEWNKPGFEFFWPILFEICDTEEKNKKVKLLKNWKKA